MKTHFVSFVVCEGAVYIIRHPDGIFFLYDVRPVFLEPFLVKADVQ